MPGNMSNLPPGVSPMDEHINPPEEHLPPRLKKHPNNRMADFEYWETVKGLATEYQYPCEKCHKLHWKDSAIGRRHAH